MGLVIQGHRFNLEAFKGKSITKAKFVKKYKDRLTDVDGVWDEIQGEIKRIKASK